MIEVKNLTKVYGGTVTAVKDLSFELLPGRIYGFLGPNGAGKTTTMNIITGYLAATSGSVTINGYDIYKDAKKAKRHIGYLPEQPPLYNELTPYEYLNVAAGLKEIPKEERRRQINEVMELTGISHVSNRLIHHLSKGYRQRVGLAQAVLGYPEIIILDEPTVGLDPKQIIEIRDLIKSLREKHTVILSSHILPEVSAVCDTVMIISKGRLVASDTPENLGSMSAQKNTVTMTIKGTSEEIERALGGVCTDLELIIERSKHESQACEVRVEGGETDPREALFFALCDARLPILGMNKSAISLEDVFLEVTAGENDEDEPGEDDGEEEEYEIVDEDEEYEDEDEDEYEEYEEDEDGEDDGEEDE